MWVEVRRRVAAGTLASAAEPVINVSPFWVVLQPSAVRAAAGRRAEAILAVHLCRLRRGRWCSEGAWAAPGRAEACAERMPVAAPGRALRPSTYVSFACVCRVAAAALY